MCDKNENPNECNYNKSTPPTNKKVRNPFERALIEKLHNPICSPGMCKMYKKKGSGSFRWEIDQACTLVPADIVVCNSQYEPSPDPVLEKIAEEANDKFFSQEMVMPSPLESSKKMKPLLMSSDSSLHISLIKPTVVTKDVPTVKAEINKITKCYKTRLTEYVNILATSLMDQTNDKRRRIWDNILELKREIWSLDHNFPHPKHAMNKTAYSFRTDCISAQTVLTLPPELPPELEKLLAPFCTFTQEQNLSGDYEITANGSLRRKLFFEEHSDAEHYDSEQTDDEIHEPQPPSSYEAHTPVVFSPDLIHSQDLATKGMKRTFGTPLNRGSSATKLYRNKILDVVDFGDPCFSPIQFKTPKREESLTSSSLASTSISPVTKVISSDEEKNDFTSPESDPMATCLDCIAETKSEKKGPCFCKITPNKSVLKRSTSLKESPRRSRKISTSFSDKRSLSMSSLHRSRSVQKLDFSMDMSIDGSLNDKSRASSETRSPQGKIAKPGSPQVTWSLGEEASIHHLVNVETIRTLGQDTQLGDLDNTGETLNSTPIKTKSKSNVRSHEISKIRTCVMLSPGPLYMSLDNSLDSTDNPLSLEEQKIDFNTVDLKFLTETSSRFNFTAQNATTTGGDSSTSFARVDSGFNENTFYASSYYESAIKPSELTITNNITNTENKTALKEISNIPWRRVDSGFKDETTADSVPFYQGNESTVKKATSFRFTEASIDKENVVTDDFDKYLTQTAKNETSISDIFTEDMTFNCDFSSTPSKNKARKVHS